MSQLPTIQPVSKDVVKQKINIELAKLSFSFQKLQDKADSIVVNDSEESVTAVKEFIKNGKQFIAAIESAYKSGKRPIIDAAKAWDEGQKELANTAKNILAPVERRYNEVCQEIDRRNRLQRAEQERLVAIRSLIDSNLIRFSQRIGDCTTKQQLADIERLINLEKSASHAAKYYTLHAEAVYKYNEVLIPVIKAQKQVIEKMESLQSQISEVEDAEKHEELSEKLAVVQAESTNNIVTVQEKAIYNNSEAVVEAEIIYPQVKPKRTDIACEIVDLEKAFKACPELLNIELKLAEAKKYGKTLIENGVNGEQESFVHNGIKYSITKIW